VVLFKTSRLVDELQWKPSGDIIYMCAFEKKTKLARQCTGYSNCYIHYYYLIIQRNATILQSFVLILNEYKIYKTWKSITNLNVDHIHLHKNGTCLMKRIRTKEKRWNAFLFSFWLYSRTALRRARPDTRKASHFP
jgi:hypothetical protein